MRRRLAKLALSCAALVAVAAGLELYLRCFATVGFLAPVDDAPRAGGGWDGRVHVPSTSPGLSYEVGLNLDLEARGMRIRTNSLGLRCAEPLPRDTPGLYRVAVVGDSMAFGFGVQQGEDFPAVLGRELAEGSASGGRRFEVLNFGVGGYSTLDEVAVLRAKALPLQPDLVLLAYCLNDPETAPLQPLQARFAPVAWWRHSDALRWLASKRQGRRIAHYGGGNYWRCLHNPEGPFWPAVAGALDEMRNLCRERGVPVLFAILPMLAPPRPWSEYPYRDIHAFLAAEARARGFEVLDLAEALSVRDPAELIVGPDDGHLNAEGNRLVARALAARLR